jgi:hypothetical protein
MHISSINKLNIQSPSRSTKTPFMRLSSKIIKIRFQTKNKLKKQINPCIKIKTKHNHKKQQIITNKQNKNVN